MENKISSIGGFATTSALTAVEDKIPDITSLVEKIDYNTTISEKKLNDHNDDKYITTSQFDKFTKDFFDARLAQANSVTKADFDTKLKSINQKINSNKTKHLLFENKLIKL